MRHNLSELLGKSSGIEAIRERIARLLERQQDARRLPTVLIEGETGTGKGLLARLIHRAGPRPDGPFVDVNCAAIPETLLEAEMFGFERGAFTDARRAKPGLFQAANRGTIFLDEVGLLSEALQAKLLKVLEERSVRRLGSTRDEHVDVWILTATNEDLRTAIRERRFREDLYHRLAVLTLSLPPLRARGDDILLLAENYLERACADYGVSAKTLSADARAALRAYAWPGNVRELANIMERVALLSSDPEVTADVLALPGVVSPSAPVAPVAPVAASSLDDAVRERVIEALRQTSWNISRTAALLGISRNTLRARIEKYGLRPGEEAPPAPPPVQRTERHLARPSPATPVVAPPTVAAPAPPPPAPASLRWERRRVTLLRAVLLAPSAPETPLETGRSIETFLDKIRSFGGSIEGRSPTGIVAAFGLDPAEDAPSRAAHAAMAIQKAGERARQDAGAAPMVKVAIHTSHILVGQGARAAELDLDGRQAALGALEGLIERAEPDTVLVSDATATFLERGFEMVELRTDLARDRAFVLMGRERAGLGRRGRAPTFVGRHRELELLSSLLESAIRGHGQVVGIAGEAGIGKSRLIVEFRESLAGKPVLSIEGRCQSYGSAVPYLPVLDVIKMLCEVTESDSAATMAEKVRTTLLGAGMDLLESAPYVLDLLGLERENRVGTLEPDDMKGHIFEVLRQLLLKVSRKSPVVLVVEDVHWTDPTSEEFLTSLAESAAGARLLLVSTYRPGYRPPWIGKSYATQVALQPLAPDDSVRVLRQALGADQPPAPLVDLIVYKAEGNPFFLEELAQAVRGQGELVLPSAVPDTIQEVLLRRIDRLPPDDKRLLELAGVVGKDVPFSVARALTDEPAESLRGAFGRLRSAEFLYETGVGPDVEYTFKHALTHEVAYASLPEAQRRALHARTVEAIERVYDERLAEQVDRLAHHALRGEVWAKAVGYLRQAAARAVARAAHREAVAHLEQALSALARLPDDRVHTEEAIDVRLDLRQSLLPLGELERALPYLREAEAIAQRLGDQHRLGRLAVFMTGQYYQMGDHDRALQYGERAHAITEALRDFGLEVATNAYLGQIHLGRGEYRAATALFRKNVEAIVGDLTQERFGLPQLPAVHSRYCLVLCLAELGEFAEALVRGQESMRIAESIEQPQNLTVAASGLGRLYLRKGELDRAIPVLARALELSRTWNLQIWFPQVATALGSAYAALGRLAHALPLLEESVERAAAMRLSSAESPSLTALGEARMLAGQLEASFEAAQKGFTVAQRNGRRGHEAWAARILGEIALRRGDVALAREHFRRGLDLGNELHMRPLNAHCQLGLGRAARISDDQEETDRRFAAAIELFREMDMGLWLTQATTEADRRR